MPLKGACNTVVVLVMCSNQVIDFATMNLTSIICLAFFIAGAGENVEKEIDIQPFVGAEAAAYCPTGSLSTSGSSNSKP